MLKYFEFISEALSKLKVPYYFSERFRDFLKKISNKQSGSASQIADFLLKCEDNIEVSDEITFIDMLDDKNDMVSFIQANRVKRMFSEDNLGYESWEDFLKDVWTDEHSNVWKKQRTQLSVGRFITRIYGNMNVKIIDSDKEEFVNVYKSMFDSLKSGESNFELVSGVKIKDWYLLDNYVIERGQLGNSCMRYQKCQSYFGIYTDNPNQVSLLILKSDEYIDPQMIVGRALIWKLVDGSYYMDRVYTIKDSDENLFEEYAKKRGWKIQESLGYSELNNLEVQLEKWNFDQYPYMDTFSCLNSANGTLSGDEDKWPADGWWKLRNTDGTYDSDNNMVWSSYHDEYLQREDAVYCEGAEDWVSVDSAIYLTYIDKYASPDEEIANCSYNGESYYTDDVVYSEYMEDFIYKNDAIKVVCNSEGDEDSVHVTLRDYVMVIEVEKFGLPAPLRGYGKTLVTLPVFIILNPLDGKYYFNDSEVGDMPIMDSIVDGVETVDREDLDKYILNSDFNISDYESKYETLTLNLPQRGDNMSALRGYSRLELTNMVKCMLIVSPEKAERRKNAIHFGDMAGSRHHLNRHIISTHANFKNSILSTENNKKIISNLMNGDLGKNVMSRWQERLFYICVIFSDAFATDLLKDPKMLATWYKLKMN